MGLDMYLRGEKFFWSDERREDEKKVRSLEVDLGYWRKHPNLHGFIVQTFAGGEDECQRIDLEEKDFDTIIKAIKARDLPHTKGFFFGKSEMTDEEAAEDIDILTKAKEWLTVDESGVIRSVYYRASW